MSLEQPLWRSPNTLEGNDVYLHWAFVRTILLSVGAGLADNWEGQIAEALQPLELLAIHAHDFSMTIGIGLSEEADAHWTHLEWVYNSFAAIALADDAAMTMWCCYDLSRWWFLWRNTCRSIRGFDHLRNRLLRWAHIFEFWIIYNMISRNRLI